MKSVVRRLLCCTLLWPMAGAWAIDSVVVQLNWRHQFQFAGYYAAIEKGYYRKLGLDVTLREFNPGTSPTDEVLSGRADFGVSASELALVRAQGKPVVALATILQNSPLVVLTPQRYRSISALKHKRIMLTPHETELFAFLKQAGIKSNEIMQQPTNFSIDALIDGYTDAISGYQTDEPYLLMQAGFSFNTFNPRSAGINFYGDTLFTSELEITEHAKRVRNFRAATLRGWDYALSHPEEIATLIMQKYSQRKTFEHLMFEATEMRKLILPDLIDIGHMSPARWEQIRTTYVDLGLLNKDSDIDGLIYDDPTMELPGWFSETFITLIICVVIAAVVGTRLIYLNRRLRQSEERYRFIVDSSADIIWEVDTDLVVRFISSSDEKLRGYRSDEVVGHHLSDLLTPKSFEYMLGRLQQRYADELSGIRTDALRYEIELRRKDGTTFWAEINSIPIRNEADEITGLHGTCRDVSERKHAEEELRNVNGKLLAQLKEIHRLQHALREQAIRDPLTSLFNRRYLDETLDREIARARREKTPLSLVMLDVDHFKRLNDTHGHRTGDSALRLLSEMLRGSVRTEDVACRFGGEEFVILLPGMSAITAHARAEAWRHAVSQLQIQAGDKTIRITASFGVAVYPDDGTDSDSLIHAADVALYHAKHYGRNRVIIFNPLLLAELEAE